MSNLDIIFGHDTMITWSELHGCLFRYIYSFLNEVILDRRISSNVCSGRFVFERGEIDGHTLYFFVMDNR